MRWKTRLTLVFCVVFVMILIIINWGWGKNLKFSEWGVLIGILIAGMVGAMSFLDKYFGILEKIRDAELKHSDDLIRDVFEKQIEICDVVYNEDKIFLSKTESRSGQIIKYEVDYDKDKVYQLCVEWNETNPLFDLAIQHLKHKKYKKTLQAYIDGKKDTEIQINKIVKKIQKYREMVERRFDNTKLPLKVRENEYSIKEGEYSKKWINHLIFYDVLKKYKTGATNKKIELFPVDLKQTSYESIFHLKWCDYNPNIKGIVGGKIVATGDRTTMEYLQNVIEWIENDKELRELVLEIVSLKSTLGNNLELKIFEAGRKEIINQVKIKRKALAGKCDECP